jgi:hypothetical protein
MAAPPALHTQPADFAAILRRWDLRTRLVWALRGWPRAIAIVLVAAVVLAGAARLAGRYDSASLALLALAGVIAALVTVTLAAALRRTSLGARAQRFDLAFGLQERVSTAVELLAGRIQTAPALRDRQIQSALAAAREVDIRAALPLPFDWRAWLAAAALAMLLVLILLWPASADDGPAGDDAAPAVASAQATLDSITQDIAASPDLDEAERAALLDALGERREELATASSRGEAFAIMSDVEAQLGEQRAELARRGSATADAARQAAAALAGREADPQGDAMEQVQRQLEALAAQPPPQGAERDAASVALAEAAQAFTNTTPALAEALQRAAEALAGREAESATQSALDAARDAAQAAAQDLAETRAGEETLAQAEEQAAAATEELATESGEGPPPPESTGGEPQAGGEGENAPDGQQLSAGAGENSILAEAGQRGEEAQTAPEAAQGTTQTGSSASDESPGQAPEADPFRQEGPARGGNNPTGGDQSTFEQVYAPQRLGGDSGPEIELDPGPGDLTAFEGEFSENPAGEARVPYRDVFTRYRAAASRALESETIPLGLRDLVRDYFSSLEPAQAP